MNVYDASALLHSDLVAWPGEGPMRRTITKDIGNDGAEVSVVTIGTHTGTHIDAPRHFIKDAPGLDSYPVDVFVGPCIVVDMTAVEGNLVEPAHLKGIDLDSVDRIVFKTKNSTQKLMDKGEFTEDYVSLSVATVELLVQKGMKLVGVDYLSIEAKGSPGHPVHVTLLEAGIPIIEGVRLIHIEPGKYHIAALPLNIKDSDGAPARVILVQHD